MLISNKNYYIKLFINLINDITTLVLPLIAF